VPAEPEGPAKWGAVPVDQPKKRLSDAEVGLPPGFVLDKQVGLPPGFKLDEGAQSAWDRFPLAKNKNENAPGLVSGTGRAFSRGAPIVGGLLNKADAATNAALSYALNPLFDEKDQLHGSPGERYQQSLDTQNKMDEAFHQEHPVLDTAAELGGGIASTGGIAKTAMGACFIAQRRCPLCLRQRGL
jgi:hypothetical protein